MSTIDLKKHLETQERFTLFGFLFCPPPNEARTEKKLLRTTMGTDEQKSHGYALILMEDGLLHVWDYKRSVECFVTKQPWSFAEVTQTVGFYVGITGDVRE